ncbi:MAG: hypothetical protein V4574_15135 [Pseudomonadota bacterium]
MRLSNLLLVPALLLAACTGASAPAGDYRWHRLTAAARYPGAYNFPVHVSPDHRFVALHPAGTWVSADGRNWVKGSLPPSGTNSAYLPVVQHDGASWAIGTIAGNYQRFTIDPVVRRTADYLGWETVGRSASLPRLIFSAAVSFKGAIWLIGGHDGTAESNAVWRSADGLAWERVVEHAPWSPRSGAKAVVFRDRLFLLGGGKLDGALSGEAWSSADGVAWVRETAALASPEPTGFTPQVFDGKLWLVGANRSGGFSSEMLVSDDGRSWRAVRAPWSPRGGVATWTDGARLYVTGGKFSRDVKGEPQFAYSNDVWAMAR